MKSAAKFWKDMCKSRREQAKVTAEAVHRLVRNRAVVVGIHPHRRAAVTARQTRMK